MGWPRSAFISALILTACIPAQAQDECPALVSAVLDATGASGLIRTLPGNIRDAVSEQMRLWANHAEGARVIQAVNNAFGPSVSDEFRTEFASGCNVANMHWVIANMSSPLAVRMRSLEELAKSNRMRPLMDGFVDELTRQQPPAARLKLLQRMDNAVGAMPMMKDTFRAVIQGLVGGSGEVPAAQPALERIHNMVLIQWLFAYRDCSDEELEQYVRILEAPAMKEFHEKYRLTFVGIMTTHAREMGYQLRAAHATPR
jgi:hypothetical protein